MKLSEITQELEKYAPISLQESYDNAGLLIGDNNQDIERALITLDVTESVLNEAIENNCQLIIAHHPVIFRSIKKLTGRTPTEKIITKAIKNDVAIYAAHTNLDNVVNGVNEALCNRIGLKNTRVLKPMAEALRKLVTFCPNTNAEQVRNAIFNAGGGHIGNYDSCSFNTEGKGTFRALEGSNPFVGDKNELHTEAETKIEAIYPFYKEVSIIKALKESHPYEEVAYDIFPLINDWSYAGAGMIGFLEQPAETRRFLSGLKKTLNLSCIRHSTINRKTIRKVAVCGGAGSFLIKEAISAGADIFLTGDIKYHDFQEATENFIIADIGHYESEQFTKDLIYAILNKKFPKFALQISDINTNFVNYL